MEQTLKSALEVIDSQSRAIEQLHIRTAAQETTWSSLFNGSRVDHCNLAARVAIAETRIGEVKGMEERFLTIAESMDRRLDAIAPMVSRAQRELMSQPQLTLL